MADYVYHTMRSRLRLERDGLNVNDRNWGEPEVEHDEGTYQRVVLTTSMTNIVSVDLGGISTATSLFLHTNRPIQFGVNSNTMLWPLSAGGSVMLTGSFTQLFLINRSSTYVATVEIAATD